ncbi:MAG: hypothetical protein L3J29_03785 [Cyclobacteriaceae bacterium]|nr:hypothetical protein [Cyclobacteriaceae bacterium]
MESYCQKLHKEISSFEKLPGTSLTKLFEKIYGYSYRNYTDDYIKFSLFIKSQSNIYLDKAIFKTVETGDKGLKEELYAIAMNKFHRRYDVLLKLKDQKYFEVVLKNAFDFLRGDDYLYYHGFKFENGQVLFDLAEAYYISQYKSLVVSFFNDAFNFAIKYAKDNKKYDYLDGHPDSTTLLILAQAIGSLQAGDREQFSSLIFRIYEFCSIDDRSYDLHQASGFIALELTAYKSLFDLQVLNRAVKVTGKHYKENTFVHQTLYSKWYLEKNIKEPLLYLQSEENKEWPSFAVFALTDLNCKEAIPVLKSMKSKEKNPVFIEIFKEAIARLNIQKETPENEDRIIWLNGSLTPTQRALGAESNNVFVARAKEKYNLDDTVYETDDD